MLQNILNAFDQAKACEARLKEGLSALPIKATPWQIEALIAYIALLIKWNQKINLTSVRSPLEMVRRHLLDSVVVLPYLRGERILDVGSGAGIPGIPLAILQEQKAFYLLDSNQKKQVFVSQVVKSLSLKRVVCVHSLVQTYQPEQKFSTILTRAFAKPLQMIELTQHLLEDKGVFLAMMGKIEEEKLLLPSDYEIEQIIPLCVPGETAQRHLTVIKKSNR